MKKLTHGLIVENTILGVTRKMSLQRYEIDTDAGKEAKYLISIETTDKDGSEIKTRIRLSEIGYEMFCVFMQNAPHDLSRFEIKDDVPKA